MIILRNKEFSNRRMSVADQDYIDDREGEKKAVKHAKAGGAALGGLMGGTAGVSIGQKFAKNPNKWGKAHNIGGAVGLAAGAVGGYYLGKKHKKTVEAKADKEIKKYLGSSDKDRKYLRDRKAREQDLELKRQMANAQSQMAWNSYRW